MFRGTVLQRRALGAVLARGRRDTLDPVDSRPDRSLPAMWRNWVAWRRPAAGRGDRPFVLNLALQGGGARGAFTWGVLDRLLEHGGVSFDGVSGTSAGAVNAVLLAGGLAEGGPKAAREKLASFWRGIGHGGGWNGAGLLADMVMRVMSPYQFNPLDIDPLRQALDRLVDFDLLRADAGIRLFLAATDVHDGRSRIFGPDEISCDAVLASASLPQIHRAVEIGGRYYWDGGYSANPPLGPLVRECEAGDTLIVQLIPTTTDRVPTTTAEISDRLNHFTFSEPLRNEVARLERSRHAVDRSDRHGRRMQRRAAGHRFHLIDATPFLRDLAPGSGMNPDWPLISRLHRHGRAAAADWLDTEAALVGIRSSTDLAARFL